MKTILLINFDYGKGVVWHLTFRPNCNLDLKVGEHFADLFPVDIKSSPSYKLSATTGYILESGTSSDERYHLFVQKISKVCNCGDPFTVVQTTVNLHSEHSCILEGEDGYEEAIFWTVMYLSLQFGVKAHLNIPEGVTIPKWFNPEFGHVTRQDLSEDTSEDPILSALT
jgi:hypothetical protein